MPTVTSSVTLVREPKVRLAVTSLRPYLHDNCLYVVRSTQRITNLKSSLDQQYRLGPRAEQAKHG